MLDIIDESEVRKNGRIIGIDLFCCYCKKIVGPEHRCKCGRNDCTGYLCDRCFRIYSPDSINNILKCISNWRNENLSRYSAVGKALIGQWIGGKTLGIEDLNIKNDNIRQPVDLYHPIYKNLDVKISTFDNRRGAWFMGTGDIHIFDHILALCMDRHKHWKNVERGYIIPIDVLDKNRYITSIGIIKNPSRGVWYEKFRTDEKPFNHTYNSVDIPEFFSPFDLWKGKYNKQCQKS
jgi:hypothetical protein